MYIVSFLDHKGIIHNRYFKKYKYAYDLYYFYKTHGIDSKLIKQERIIFV